MRLSENKARRVAERIVDELEQNHVLSYTTKGPNFRSERIKVVYELIMADVAAEAEIDREVDRVLDTYSRTLRATERDILYRKHKEEIARRRNFEL